MAAKDAVLVPSFGGCVQLQLSGETGKGGARPLRGPPALPGQWKRSLHPPSCPLTHSRAGDRNFFFSSRAIQSPRIRRRAQSCIFLLCNLRTRDDHVSVGPAPGGLPHSSSEPQSVLLARGPPVSASRAPGTCFSPALSCLPFPSAFLNNRCSFISCLSHNPENDW